MSNIIDECGLNAEKVWRTLNSQGPLSEPRLTNATKLTESQFYAAIGWLARENRIYKSGTTYKLGDTNLTSKIGDDAGKIWKILDTMKEIDISVIAKITQVDERDAYSALGWLARENKIEAKNIIKLK